MYNAVMLWSSTFAMYRVHLKHNGECLGMAYTRCPKRANEYITRWEA